MNEYHTLIEQILTKQKEAIGVQRVLTIALTKMRLVSLDKEGLVSHIRGDGSDALEEVVNAYLGSFPLSKTILNMQLCSMKNNYPELKIPTIPE